MAPMITATVPGPSAPAEPATPGVPAGAIASHPTGPPTSVLPAVVNTAPHMVPPGADEAHGPLHHRSPATPRSPRVERVSMRLPGDRPGSPFSRSSGSESNARCCQPCQRHCSWA